MPLTFNGSIMKVGNSLVMVLPKPLVDNFKIEKGDSMDLIVTDKGIYIPLIKKIQSNNKDLERIMKQLEKGGKS